MLRLMTEGERLKAALTEELERDGPRLLQPGERIRLWFFADVTRSWPAERAARWKGKPSILGALMLLAWKLSLDRMNITAVRFVVLTNRRVMALRTKPLRLDWEEPVENVTLLDARMGGTRRWNVGHSRLLLRRGGDKRKLRIWTTRTWRDEVQAFVAAVGDEAGDEAGDASPDHGRAEPAT